MKTSATSPYVLEFAELMEKKLDENRHKGDREGWRGCALPTLLHRLRQEVAELEDAASEWRQSGVTAEEVARECADVANFAMMIADRVGGVVVGGRKP